MEILSPTQAGCYTPNIATWQQTVHTKPLILSQDCWCLELASCPARGLGQFSLRVMRWEGTEGAVVAPCCQPVTSPPKSCEHVPGLCHSLANRCMAFDETGSVVFLLTASLSQHAQRQKHLECGFWPQNLSFLILIGVCSCTLCILGWNYVWYVWRDIHTGKLKVWISVYTPKCSQPQLVLNPQLPLDCKFLEYRDLDTA